MSDLRNDVVSAIQGNPVSPNTPISGQQLVWDGTKWSPTTITTPDTITLSALTVTNIYANEVGSAYPITLQGTTISMNAGGGDCAITVDETAGMSVAVPGGFITTATPATGSAGALPPTPAGYLQVMINGNPQYIAFY
jgi:hypothetical protein